MSQGRTRRGTVSLPGRGAAGSLVDELRTIAPVSAPAASSPPTTPAPVTAAPAPPPRKQRQSREQFSTKLPPALIQDLRAFCDHHQAEIQVVVELGLVEYLTSRGWKTST